MDYEVPDHPEYRVWFKHYRYPTYADYVAREYRTGCISRRVAHSMLRYYFPEHFRGQFTPSNYGGITECYIYDTNACSVIARGGAECSLSDRFCYRTGRDIAFGRAMKQLRENTRRK